MSKKLRRDVKLDFVEGTNLLNLVDAETGIPFRHQQKTIVESYNEKGRLFTRITVEFLIPQKVPND